MKLKNNLSSYYKRLMVKALKVSIKARAKILSEDIYDSSTQSCLDTAEAIIADIYAIKKIEAMENLSEPAQDLCIEPTIYEDKRENGELLIC